MEVRDDRTNIGWKSQELEVFPDGGKRVIDVITGAEIKVCPYMKVGDCFRLPEDAMSCPDEYTGCHIYQTRVNERFR